jgi:hypothetical protein
LAVTLIRLEEGCIRIRNYHQKDGEELECLEVIRPKGIRRISPRFQNFFDRLD